MSSNAKMQLNLQRIMICSLIVILLIWGCSLFLLNLEKNLRGTIGDIFNVAGTLFSGLAFGGIIITILLQRQELILQREELKYTREELKRSADSQEESQKSLKRQAENLKISAKLSALNTLVTFYSERESYFRGVGGYSYNDAKQQREKYLARIEELLNNKENDL